MKPCLTKEIFWDIDIRTLDFDAYPRFVIARVLMRGTVRDWNAIKVYYGLETIKREALAARYFDAKTLSFCSVYFNIPKTEFRCFTGRQLTRKHWNY